MAGLGGMVRGKWKQLYLNNNKNKQERNMKKYIKNIYITVCSSIFGLLIPIKRLLF